MSGSGSGSVILAEAASCHARKVGDDFYVVQDYDFAYLQLLRKVLSTGVKTPDRTGVGTYSLFGQQLNVDLNQGFPLLTTKKMHVKSIIAELLWFLRGDTNVEWLHKHGCTIWDEWADEEGELGPIYGSQWRSWPTADGSVDQIRNLVEGLRQDPYGRRHIVSAWNPACIQDMALPPCHALFQMYYRPETGLCCMMYQRSADLFLGVPFNVASYALLTYLIAHFLKVRVGRLQIVFGDCHIYQNHTDAVELQLTRDPLPTCNRLVYTGPEIQIWQDLITIEPDDLKIENYFARPAIKAPVAV